MLHCMYVAVCVWCTSLCASNMYVERLHLVSSGCSTSTRLSDEIRSRACPPTHTHPPPLPSSFPFSPLLLSACPLVSIPLCSSPHPYSSSRDTFFFSIFFHYAADCKAQASAHVALLSDCILSLSILLSLSVSPLCFSLCVHICDQIMRHIMGLVSLMACIKV